MKRKYLIAALSAVSVLLIAVLIAAAVLSPYRASARLIRAIGSGDVQKTEDLLKRGADPNCPNAKRGFFTALAELQIRYPLSTACELGDVEMVRVLLSYGARPEETRNGSWDAISSTLLRFQEDDLEILQLLMENGASAAECPYEEPYVFLAAEMQVQNYAPDGTPLYTYNSEVGDGVAELVDYLLSFESDPGLPKTQGGRTLLMCAAQTGNQALIADLLSRGADPGEKDSQGDTAYDYAVRHHWDEAAQLIRQAMEGSDYETSREE